MSVKNLKILTMLIIFLSYPGLSAVEKITGSVSQVLIDDTRYAGCLVFIESSLTLAEVGLECPDSYFTFDCLNKRNISGGKGVAYKKLATAQLALALDAQVQLTIDDSLVPGGRCYAERIVIFNPKE